VRVVLDPDERLPANRQVFADAAARTIVVRRARSGQAAPSLEDDVLTLPARDAGRFDPAELLQVLRSQGWRRILVEGGGITVSRFVEAGVVDRLHVTVAPLLIGSGRPALTLPPIDSLDQALRPPCRHFRLGDDILFDLALH
jgi:riboflavin biosynthesis pyrimidine reductase